PRPPGATAGTRLHACAAARRRARGGCGVVRAGHRCARQEHPPQDRGRPAGTTPPADGLWRRIPARRPGGMSAERPPGPPWGWHGGRRWGGPGRRPPWWPHDRPWPPRGPEDWRRYGRRMARRAGCVLVVAIIVMVGAGTALVWLILSALGIAGSAPFARVISALGLLLGVSAFVAAASALRRL